MRIGVYIDFLRSTKDWVQKRHVAVLDKIRLPWDVHSCPE